MAVSDNARKLKELRTRAGLTSRGLAKLLGWSAHTRVQYYEDEFKGELLPQSVVKEIAPHLVGKGRPPIAEGDVLALAGMATAEPVAEQPSPNAVIAPDAARPPLRQDMPKDVPVYGTGQGGDGDGDFELNGQIVDYVRRPPRIAGRRDVFAIYLQGRSMWPWRDSGQLVYAETARAAKNLDFVIVEMKPTPSDDVRPALVKRLLAVTPNKVKLEQFNPAKTIEIDGRKILKIYRIMDWDELLGV